MGAREFTDADERTRRRDRVYRIGEAAFGAERNWHADMAKAIEVATGRTIGRARIAQWFLTTADVKPVPAWVVEALPAIAAAAAADLRARAAALDTEIAVEDGGAPPAQGEPDAPEEPSLESGPAAAADGDEFDTAGFLEQVLSEPPRDLGTMPTFVPEMHVVYSNVEGRALRQTRRS
ncbi:MAG TPA: hypothetical protein VGU70_21420 [Methylobacterium sp.]|jgi:hypothetical protein|nr:hypothetical protein [Methylobacterium sp.]